MRRRLIILEDPFPPREVIPQEESLDIGRDTERGIVLNHRTVSRRHAVIRQVEGSLVMEDLGSTYGTLVNDRPLEKGKSVILEDGDVLRFGKIRVICRFEDHDVDLESSARDAAFAAQANARVLLLEGDYVHRRPLAGVVTLIGCAAHCEVRVHDSAGPPEQAVIRAVDGRYRIESRSRAKPPLLNEKQTPVTEPQPLPSNSALLVHKAQLLFLYDFTSAGQPIEDGLVAVSRATLLSHVSEQCGVSVRSLRQLTKNRRVLGQKLGEILVEKDLITPLFWRVLCARLLERPHRRTWPRLFRKD